jgi:hypothetical protein
VKPGAADALVADRALGSGRLYDRVRLRGLIIVPLLAALVPFLSFSTVPLLVWLGAGAWGGSDGRPRVHDASSGRGPRPNRASRGGIWDLHRSLCAGLARWWHAPRSCGFDREGKVIATLKPVHEQE